jgi:hypothetical protein
MRCASATDIKNNRNPKNTLPAAGTKMGKIYDQLKENKGEPVVITHHMSPGAFGATLMQLRDYYGLDVRQIQRANKKRGLEAKHCLVGEWFGNVYVDYIAEKMEENNDQKRGCS